MLEILVVSDAKAKGKSGRESLTESARVFIYAV